MVMDESQVDYIGCSKMLDYRSTTDVLQLKLCDQSERYLEITVEGQPKFPSGYVKGAILSGKHDNGFYRPLYRMALRLERFKNPRKTKTKKNSGSNSSEFMCKCGKQKGWITEGQQTLPCPECGRLYVGYYDKKKLTIAAKEIK